MEEPETKGPQVYTCTSYPLYRVGGENRVEGEVGTGGRGVKGRERGEREEGSPVPTFQLSGF